MYTINQGVNGGWYGSVVAEDPTDLPAMAKALATALSAIREANPKPEPKPRSPKPKQLNDEGKACLTYYQANPTSTMEDFKAAGHKRRAVDWLVKHGFMPEPAPGEKPVKETQPAVTLPAVPANTRERYLEFFRASKARRSGYELRELLALPDGEQALSTLVADGVIRRHDDFASNPMWSLASLGL